MPAPADHGSGAAGIRPEPAWGRSALLASGAVALLLIVYAYAGTFTTLWRAWSHNDNYSHGFLILPISLVLVFRLRKELRATPVRPTWTGLPLVAGSALLQIVGIRGDVAMFQAYSFIGLTGGLVWTWFGGAIMRRLAFPIIFLVFMAPTFPVFINQVSFRLKTVAAFGSVRLAQLLGVSVSRQGMDLLFPTGVMTIEGACSGLNSLIALMAMGALFAYMGSGALWRRWLLFLLSIPVALGANIARISSLCVYAAFTDTEKATGLFHDVGGFVLFGVALISMMVLKRLLRC